MDHVVEITLQDEVQPPSDEQVPVSRTHSIFCRVPIEWIDGVTLKEPYLEPILEALYGLNWRMGNPDGSRYVVQGWSVRILTAEQEEAAEWRSLPHTRDLQTWYFTATPSGDVEEVDPVLL